MKMAIWQLGTVLLLTSCSGPVDLDAAATLPGSWLCDDGIIITFNANGKYEWRIPSDGEVTLYVEGNEYIRMNDDGGYSILDEWTLNGDFLEMNMLGETDRYILDFISESKFRIVGPDTFSCQLQ